MIGELFNLHEKFDNYMNRCFFEMKMEISKRCIVLEEEVSRRIDRLMKTRKRRDSNGETSGASSRTSILANISGTASVNKIPSAD